MSLIASCSCQKSGNDSSFPAYPIKGGVSAPFAGFSGDYMIVSGGCNFPDIPASEGGKKKYYDDTYIINIEDKMSQWNFSGKIPYALAYGASAETDYGLVCIGGLCADSAVTRTFCMSLSDEADGKSPDLQITDMPSLPESIDNGAAVGLNNTVYVTGGNQSGGGNSLYMLEQGDSVWRKLNDYPSDRRVQPVLLVSENILYLAGGFSYDKASNSCVLHSDMLPYDIETGEWGSPIPFPLKSDGSSYAISGGTGVVYEGRLILTGGVDYKIFKEAMEGRGPSDYMKKPAEWYRFNDDVLVYDIKKGTWSIERDIDGMNKAGGVMLVKDNKVFMVCGEIKPGVRTPEIVVAEMSGKEGDMLSVRQ